MYVTCRTRADKNNEDATVVGFPYRLSYSMALKLPVNDRDTWFVRKLTKAPAPNGLFVETDANQIEELVKRRSHNLDDHGDILKAGKIDPDNYFEQEEIFIAGWLVFR
jgi:hypothetical protein